MFQVMITPATYESVRMALDSVMAFMVGCDPGRLRFLQTAEPAWNSARFPRWRWRISFPG